MKHWILLIFPLLLIACADETAPQPPEIILPLLNSTLHDLGPAPELTNDSWLNVDAPLRLADLRGNVVAIDMWTFG